MATTLRFRRNAFNATVVAVVVGAFYALLQLGFWIDERMSQRMREDQAQWQAQFDRDVKEGKRLPTGETVITDTTTGCKYIRTTFYFGQGEIGYSLTPRFDEDARPMGCKRR